MTSDNDRDDDASPGPDASSDSDFDWDERAPDDLRADLEQRRSRRPGVLTMVLMALILVAGGFAVGAVVGRNSASASASPAGPGAFPTGGAVPGGGEVPGGGVPTGGPGLPGGGDGLPGGGFPGGGGFTAGMIEGIQGDTVYVRTSDGKTVKVNTSPSTNVNITKQGAISDLAKGQTVTVIGTQDDSGSIEAVQISEGGGFPGGGFPGGGFPGAPGASPAPSSAP